MTDVHFEPSNPLEEAMVTASLDPSKEAAFKKVLFRSEVLIPQDGPAPETERLVSATEGSTIEFPVIEGGEGPFIPVFSSMEQLLKYVPAGTHYLQMQMSDVVLLWPSDCRMAINPRGDIGTALDPKEIKALSGKAGYLLGKPAEEPEALLQTVTMFAERTPEVRACYRAQAQEQGAIPVIAIGVELDEGADREQIFARLTEAGRESGVAAMGLVSIERDAPGTVARFMLEETEPFYVRP